MPIFGPENVNSVKTTLYYGPKKSIECHFFYENAGKYTIITAKKKVKHHFKLHYSINQKNVKNVKKVQQYFQIPYNIIHKKKSKNSQHHFFANIIPASQKSKGLVPKKSHQYIVNLKKITQITKKGQSHSII